MGLGGGGIAFDDATVAADEELGEVPVDVAVFLDALADGLEQCRRSFGFQAFILLGGCDGLEVGEEGVLVLAVHVDLLHYLETHAVVDAAELLNLAVGAGVLVGELGAGEAYADQAALAVLLVEGLEAVELRCEAALGGGVDDEQYFAFKLFEVNLFAVAGDGFVIVNS